MMPANARWPLFKKSGAKLYYAGHGRCRRQAHDPDNKVFCCFLFTKSSFLLIALQSGTVSNAAACGAPAANHHCGPAVALKRSSDEHTVPNPSRSGMLRELSQGGERSASKAPHSAKSAVVNLGRCRAMRGNDISLGSPEVSMTVPGRQRLDVRRAALQPAEQKSAVRVREHQIETAIGAGIEVGGVAPPPPWRWFHAAPGAAIPPGCAFPAPDRGCRAGSRRRPAHRGG